MTRNQRAHSVTNVGTFSVPIEIGDERGERWEQLDALVDTGATYTQVAADLLERLGVTPEATEEFVTADGRVVERPMAETTVRLDGRRRHTIILFGEPQTPALLGAYTLEGFGLAVDPVRRRLAPARLYLL